MGDVVADAAEHSAEALPSFRSQENDWAWALEGGLTLHLSTGEKRAVLHQDDAARDPLAAELHVAGRRRRP